MLNVHIYPGTIQHESRIMRETMSIQRTGLFDSIEIAGINTGGLPSTEHLTDRISIRRFNVHEGDNFRGKLSKTTGLARAAYRYYSQQPVSCVNCHSVATLPLCLALARKTGAKLVYDTHELETETNSSKGLQRLIYKSIERIGIRHVDHTLVVTESIENWYRETYGISTIDTFYNFPQPVGDIPKLPDDYFQERFGLDPTTTIYLFQGVFTANRGILELIEAFDALPTQDSALVLLGFGEWTEMLERKVARTRNCFIHPGTSPLDLPAYTRAADVGMLVTPSDPDQCLSYLYSGGNKVFQYLQAGLPVILSDIVEHRQLLTKYKTGILIDAPDPASIHRAMDELAELRETDDFKVQMQNAQLDLNWDTYDQRFAEIYSALVSGHGS